MPREVRLGVADAYARQLVDSIMSSTAWCTGQNAVVITWDEGTDNARPGGVTGLIR